MPTSRVVYVAPDRDLAQGERVIEVSGLRHAFDGRLVVAVESWAAAAGEHWFVHGPSGCGKTTLLHLVAGLRRPDAGAVRVAGQDLSALSGGALDRFRGRHIGIVFQGLHLIAALTVRQNLALARSLAGLGASPGRIDALLDGLGLADRADARPHALSRGEAQRAALARALVNEPAVVLADEPTSSLDDDNAARAAALLRDRAQASGATLAVASHDRRIAGAFPHRLDLSGGAS